MLVPRVLPAVATLLHGQMWLSFGTEATALEQNSIIHFSFFVYLFKHIFRTALCQKKKSSLFISQLTEVFTFEMLQIDF